MFKQSLLFLLFQHHFFIVSIPPLDHYFKELCYEMALWPYPYRYASPLYGLFCSQTSEIKNQFLFGHNESLKKLLGFLFHVTVGNEFCITAHEPYSKFNTLIITEVIKWTLRTMEGVAESHDLLIETIRPILRGNKSPKRLKEFFSTIEQCLRQENFKNIRPYSTVQALTTFMLLQATSTQELNAYVKDLGTTFDASIKRHRSISIEEVDRQLIELIFRKAQAYADSKKFSGPINYLRTISYKNNPPIADCTEAVVLDLARIIYSNLPEKKWNQAVIQNFMSKYDLQKIAENKDARHEWMKLCSEQSNISYRKQGYEVNPSLKNITILLRTFFGLPVNEWESWLNSKDNYWEEEFKKICTTVSHSSFSVECIRMRMKSDTYGDAQVKFQKLIENKPISLTAYLHIRQDHTWLSRSMDDESEDNSIIFKSIISNKNFEDTAYIAGLHSKEMLTQLHKTVSEMGSVNLIGQLKQWLMDNTGKKQLLYTFPTNSDEHIYHLVKHAVIFYHESKDDYYRSFAIKVINAINDTHFLYKSLLTVTSYGFHNTFKPLILNKVSQLENDEQEDIAHSLVYHKAYKDIDYHSLSRIR